jgi:hypothetical protein
MSFVSDFLSPFVLAHSRSTTPIGMSASSGKMPSSLKRARPEHTRPDSSKKSRLTPIVRPMALVRSASLCGSKATRPVAEPLVDVQNSLREWLAALDYAGAQEAVDVLQKLRPFAETRGKLAQFLMFGRDLVRRQTAREQLSASCSRIASTG